MSIKDLRLTAHRFATLTEKDCYTLTSQNECGLIDCFGTFMQLIAFGVRPRSMHFGPGVDVIMIYNLLLKSGWAPRLVAHQ